MQLLRHAVVRAVTVSAFSLFLHAASLSAAGVEELRGSPQSMLRQYRVALQSGFSFASTPGDLNHLVFAGRLVPLNGNADYAVVRASYAFALPAVRLMIERLSADYHAATDDKLIVTSLARPTAGQPRNAHRLSVHPAGMAIDLRIPKDVFNRLWLERELLRLEGERVLDATLEQRPPHYHVAVFPVEYMAYVEGLRGGASGNARTASSALTKPAHSMLPVRVMNAASSRVWRQRDLALLVLLFPIWILAAPRVRRNRASHPR